MAAAHPRPEAIQRLHRFLAERGFHAGGRNEPGRLAGNAILVEPDSPHRMTLRPFRFEWDFIEFGKSWHISLGLLVSRNKGSSFEASTWRAVLDALSRDEGFPDLDSQVDFFVSRLDEIQQRVAREGVDAWVARLKEGLVRINAQWPRELCDFREWLLQKGYVTSSQSGPDSEFFGNEQVTISGDVISVEFLKDRGVWSVAAGRTGIGAQMHPAEVWRAWIERRRPIWDDARLGTKPYVADVEFFKANLDLMRQAVRTPQPAEKELHELAIGRWEGEPEWRGSYRSHFFG